jgi:predicted nucleic acid-binding protein
MPGGEACLLDSNILLRISKSDDPQHAAISYALHALVGHGVRLCYTSQTLAEFWNASTRPLDKNGFGLSVAETDRLARVIERDFEFLPDSREVHDGWRSLLVAHNTDALMAFVSSIPPIYQRQHEQETTPNWKRERIPGPRHS